MHFLRVNPGDAATLRACHDVMRSAERAEDPLGPPTSPQALAAFLAQGWVANPCEAWLAAAGDGAALGWCWLDLPDREDRRRAEAVIVVGVPQAGRDAAGRLGTARELLGQARARAQASGRTDLSVAARVGSPADELLRASPAQAGHLEVRRVLDLRKAPAGHVSSLRETAAGAAAGYSLAHWAGATPPGRLDGVAALLNAMNDALRAQGAEDAAWDAGRVRERADSFLALAGVRRYSVAAIHDATGAMAARTQLEVDPASPEWGRQAITAVTRPHRGRRLGLLVKAAMLGWLADAEPGLERIETGNAGVNAHMIAVNEALGFEILEPGWQSYETALTDAR
jgi:RimJ/RimL family protein N-acetyltransferase